MQRCKDGFGGKSNSSSSGNGIQTERIFGSRRLKDRNNAFADEACKYLRQKNKEVKFAVLDDQKNFSSQNQKPTEGKL